MHEAIIEFIKSHSEGVTSKEIAEKFLKFKNPPENIAYAAIYGILSGDIRCFKDNNSLWRVIDSTQHHTGELLERLPLTAVYVIKKPLQDKIDYVALWDIFPTVTYKWGVWLTDFSTPDYDGGEMLLNGPDEKFDATMNELHVARLCTELNNTIPIILSNDYIHSLSSLCLNADDFLSDDAIVLNELLQAASIPLPSPLTLDSMADSILKNDYCPASAFRQGELFATCIFELLKILQAKGYRTRDDIDKFLLHDSSNAFIGKSFSYEDLVNQPESQGVYGFKNNNAVFIHIGKSKNIKRRLLSCFKKYDHSSNDVSSMSADIKSFVSYQCASELESALYYYRLIKKYSPVHNQQNHFSKLNVSSCSIHNCIILLPHVEPKKCMTFWFKKDQKIIIKPLNVDWQNNEGILEELEQFFFLNKPIPGNQDLIELEIVSRWFKKNENMQRVISVDSFASAPEIFESIKTYWNIIEEKGL